MNTDIISSNNHSSRNAMNGVVLVHVQCVTSLDKDYGWLVNNLQHIKRWLTVLGTMTPYQGISSNMEQFFTHAGYLLTLNILNTGILYTAYIKL
jgi:hypothetical protein